MKRVIYILSLLAILCISCEEYEVPVASISDIRVIPSEKEVDVKFAVRDQYGNRSYSTIDEVGLFLSKKPNPTEQDQRHGTTNFVYEGNGEYVHFKLTNLEPNTTYYALPYIRNAISQLTGREVSFTTKGTVSVVAKDPTDISFTSATLNAVVSTNGNVNISKCGFVVSTSSHTPTLSNNDMNWSESFSMNNISHIATSLQPNKTYYFRAFAIVEGNEIYSSTKEFSTLNPESEITISLGAATNISSSSADISGSITIPEQAKYEIWRCGFFVSKQYKPSNSNWDKYVSNYDVFSWTGTHDLSYSITGLSPNTTYYYRMYYMIGDYYYYSESTLDFTTYDSSGGSSSTLGSAISDFVGSYHATAYVPNIGEYLSWDTVKIVSYVDSNNTTSLRISGLFNGYSYFSAKAGHNPSTNSIELYNGIYFTNDIYYYNSDVSTDYYSVFHAVYYNSSTDWGDIQNMTGGEAVFRFNSNGKLVFGPREVPDASGRYANGYVFIEYKVSDDSQTSWRGVFTQLELTKLSSTVYAPSAPATRTSVLHSNWHAPMQLPAENSRLLMISSR